MSNNDWPTDTPYKERVPGLELPLAFGVICALAVLSFVESLTDNDWDKRTAVGKAGFLIGFPVNAIGAVIFAALGLAFLAIWLVTVLPEITVIGLDRLYKGYRRRAYKEEGR